MQMFNNLLVINMASYEGKIQNFNLKSKNLQYICQVDNEGHIPSFNLQCRLAAESVRRLFPISIFNLFIKMLKYEKWTIWSVFYLSRVCHKQSLSTKFSPKKGVDSKRHDPGLGLDCPVLDTIFHEHNSELVLETCRNRPKKKPRAFYLFQSEWNCFPVFLNNRTLIVVQKRFLEYWLCEIEYNQRIK